MDEEITGTPRLWIHQEKAIISAESHEIWRFTPDFLVSSGIVPVGWTCRRASRNQSTVEIQYGPIHWQMSERYLWITSSPDCPLGEGLELEGNPIIPVMASKFLDAVPLLPSRRFWFYWQVSAVNPTPLRWMPDNFLPRGWPTGFVPAISRTNFNLSKDNLTIQMAVKNESAQRQNQTIKDSIIFECHVSQGLDQDVHNMVLATDHWAEWLGIVEQAINYLLEGSEP